MTEREKVIARHKAEGEPTTMARVEGMCVERWPHRGAIVWIETAEPRRHVSVRFARDAIHGAASTWLEAMDAVDNERIARRIGY